ncbi:YoaK family protein [Ancylobacter amanitiformis]|uniref:Oxalate decarboxylase n=1 Tax=Ancylobacter amanitiformis TaxID=217069 RepID=A0ABU0LRH0_9HYPH|nr:YoaK family protein [Ancylobacter amanitiformis]MDQ0511263.1 oxalate decarboxylase [Ancylobacter amanitiformis]
MSKPVSIRPFIFATFATLIAGFVDAVGYTQLGGLYVSFMSGNSTRLGIQIAGADWAHVAFTIGVIGSFILGAFLGAVVCDAVGDWKLVAVLSTEVALFALATVLTLAGVGFLALLPIATAMGMQNNVHQVIAGADIGKSFVTGALVSCGQALARRMAGKEGPKEASLYAFSWVTFVSGAALGAVMLHGVGLSPAVGGACLLLAALALTAYAFHDHIIQPFAAQGGD